MYLNIRKDVNNMSEVVTRVGISPFSARQHIGVYRSFLVNLLVAKKLSGKTFLRIDDTNPKHRADIDEMVDDMSKIIEPSLFSPIHDKELGKITVGNAKISAILESGRSQLYVKYLEMLQKKDFVFYREGATYLDVAKYIELYGDMINVSFQGRTKRMVSISRVIPKLCLPIVVDEGGRFLWHFTSVIDDATLNVTHIVRAQDKIDNQVPQTIINKTLEFSAPKYLYAKIIFSNDHLPTTDELLAKNISIDAIKSYLYGTITGYSDKIYLFFEEALEDFSIESVVPGQFKFDMKKYYLFRKPFLKSTNHPYISDMGDFLFIQNEPIIFRVNFDHLPIPNCIYWIRMSQIKICQNRIIRIYRER